MDPRATVTIGRGLAIGELGLGLVPLGNMFRAITDDEAQATLETWWAAGLRTYDVAPVYGYGIAERRLGRFLATKRREEFVISTKVGRRLVRDAPPEPALFHAGEPKFKETPPGIGPIFDFSADGVRRSLDESLERLGLDRVDFVYIHDPYDHQDQAIREAHPSLADLREQGVLRAIGVGVGDVPTLLRFAREADPDVFMLAGRYTLLDQTALPELFPLCVERGIRIVSCSVFNSGLLADPRPGAAYDYAPADDAVLDRARRIRAVTAEAGVDVKSVAMQYGYSHPAVAAMVIGARTARQAAEVIEAYRADVPEHVWARLRDELGIPLPRVPAPEGVAA
jgi:D-threo-aldose 1-dehydrogenase